MLSARIYRASCACQGARVLSQTTLCPRFAEVPMMGSRGFWKNVLGTRDVGSGVCGLAEIISPFASLTHKYC
jgi:hypothetical protein